MFVRRKNNFLSTCRGVATGDHGPPTSISKPKKVHSFSFKDQGYCFLLVFRNFGNRSLHVGPSEKIQYLMLDLVKRFLL